MNYKDTVWSIGFLKCATLFTKMSKCAKQGTSIYKITEGNISNGKTVTVMFLISFNNQNSLQVWVRNKVSKMLWQSHVTLLITTLLVFRNYSLLSFSNLFISHSSSMKDFSSAQSFGILVAFCVIMTLTFKACDRSPQSSTMVQCCCYTYMQKIV